MSIDGCVGIGIVSSYWQLGGRIIVILHNILGACLGSGFFLVGASGAGIVSTYLFTCVRKACLVRKLMVRKLLGTRCSSSTKKTPSFSPFPDAWAFLWREAGEHGGDSAANRFWIWRLNFGPSCASDRSSD
ncbi:uncharacterized protein BDR25DRAFT_43877 [Lindgomyces ingoldianus]|uniref:Uncharacterized protein n=1 Tax=Lindgomyces ingoldianus TaxID=673940 RepID=A0ACB6REG5_9PLEO|nr:uncharacterized protein BDR25DRAFT_43877 [Lindgomyces ingoldianus]KAF2477143.1 hypothetical protein BDR25DRAFT_43877 [Lindgomyces ingoldianus]